METEPSTHQDRKTVHDHLKYRSLKVLIYQGLKPVVIQFCTNRCRTRFTTDERDRIIQKFIDRGSHYAPLVEFLFRTGCRPSEEIALQVGFFCTT